MNIYIVFNIYFKYVIHIYRKESLYQYQRVRMGADNKFRLLIVKGTVKT